MCPPATKTPTLALPTLRFARGEGGSTPHQSLRRAGGDPLHPDYRNDRSNQAALEGNARLKKLPDIPAQREARLQKALALKAAAQALALADGGTMTKSDQRYIQKKADRIMSE